MTLENTQSGQSNADCAAGELAVGGGYTLTSTDLIVTSTVKSSTSETWLVDVTNNGATATFTAFVICARTS
ncbi:hypothetical protein AB0C59_01950 [Streptomyces sp. NPDC048664]|uniref:hypothetical protein n=1 Tax=Streptomyces sp. NPDC048664 TaxID=3154505 RepID=UPI0034416DBE